MGYPTYGDETSFKWGEGELICASCLKDEKPKLYLCKYSGRQIFCSSAYYQKYWREDSKAKLIRTPEDHQQQLSHAAKGQKRKSSDKSTTTTTTEGAKKQKEAK